MNRFSFSDYLKQRWSCQRIFQTLFAGVGEAISQSEWKWSKRNRAIVSGGVFGDFMMTPSHNSVVVIDGKRRHVQCEWQDISHGNIIVWVDPLHL